MVRLITLGLKGRKALSFLESRFGWICNSVAIHYRFGLVICPYPLCISVNTGFFLFLDCSVEIIQNL